MFATVLPAERLQFQKPIYKVELGDTTQDYVGLGAEGDSHATVRFDEETKTYFFKFKCWERGEWVTIQWCLSSNIDMRLGVEVRKSHESNRLEYRFSALESETTPYRVARLIFAVDSPVLSSTEENRGWRGRMLPEGWEGSYWTWTRIFARLKPSEVESPGLLTLASFGLPSPKMCWSQANTPDISSMEGEPITGDCDLPESVVRAIYPNRDIFKDAAWGVTVAPGLTTVELPALRKYFDISVEQGWLEDGPYREELRVLLEDAVGHHESGETEGVLEALKRFSDKVDAVYAEENSPMLSEAYALFHFNAAYLMEHYGKEADASPGEEQEQPTSTAVLNQP